MSERFRHLGRLAVAITFLSGFATSSTAVTATVKKDVSVTAQSQFVWNEKQGTCLDTDQRPGFNRVPLGKNAQCVDFSNQNLTGMDFTGYDLRGANFQNATLRGVLLTDAQIKGLVLTGADLENGCLVQWLTTGAPPPSGAPCGTTKNRDRPFPAGTSIIVNLNFLPGHGDPQSDTQTKAIDDIFSPQVIGRFHNSKELRAYLAKTEHDSKLGQLGTQVQLAAQELERDTNQSMLRIQTRKLQEARADLTSGLVIGEAGLTHLQNEISLDQSALRKLNKSVSNLSSSIQDDRKIYAAYSRVRGRAEKAAQTIKSSNPHSSNSQQSLAASLVELKGSIQSLQAEIKVLFGQENQLSSTVGLYNDQIDNISRTVENFFEDIDAAVATIQSLQGQIASAPNSGNSISLQNSQVTQVVATLKVQVIRALMQVAKLRQHSAADRAKLNALIGQILIASDKLQRANDQLQDINTQIAVHRALSSM